MEEHRKRQLIILVAAILAIVVIWLLFGSFESDQNEDSLDLQAPVTVVATATPEPQVFETLEETVSENTDEVSIPQEATPTAKPVMATAQTGPTTGVALAVSAMILSFAGAGLTQRFSR